MNDTIFSKNFIFNEFCSYKTQHVNNSRGVEYHFIGFLRHGKARIVSQSQTLEIKENQMFYIPKGCKYHSYWIAEDYVKWDSIGFLYFPTLAPNGYTLQIIDYDKTIFDSFAPLSKDKTISSYSIGVLYNLLGKLESKLIQAPIDNEIAVYENLILSMQKNPHLTIPQYASILEISESLLYHYVKKVSNKTPNRIRQEILCQKAQTLLCTTNDSIEEICDKLKFSSSTYFRKVFYSIYKKSPTTVRKEQIRI